MNCPSRPDDIEGHPDWNQNPSPLSRDLTTRADFNGIVNLREQREADSDLSTSSKDPDLSIPNTMAKDANDKGPETRVTVKQIVQNTTPFDSEQSTPYDSDATSQTQQGTDSNPTTPRLDSIASVEEDAAKTTQVTKKSIESTSIPYDSDNSSLAPSQTPRNSRMPWFTSLSETKRVLIQYSRFIGPGFLIAVAYIDPGNYATDVAAGANTRFAHLFIILMSNLFAIFLQSLCIKLGSVTGLDLAQNCRKHLPKWLTITLYILSEAAIIATDIAEVIGTAIALNLLGNIPLVAGCAISLVDVILLLFFYNPHGGMGKLRIFEFFVMCLVLGVLVCFCIQLSYVKDTLVGEVFRGYVPSKAIVEGNGIYLSCGILGATVMPHSIFLGSGVCQPRLKELDIQLGNHEPNSSQIAKNGEDSYRPSLQAIKTGLRYSIVELSSSLFTFALFINSAILIVAGASIYPNNEDADLFGIFNLMTSNIGKAAGILFALALLLSGTSAGIVCTMAGQMVSEGMINWTVAPWLRRLVTRLISIIPSIIIAAAIGKQGLNTALTASQVVLSVILPFVTAPLLYFTCKSSIMTVNTDEHGRRMDQDWTSGEKVNMRNSWITTIFAVLIWGVLVIMNVALLVLVGLGKV